MPKKKTKEEFIKEATEKHKGKYDYSKVEYVNNYTKVCISCPKSGHGEFWQIPGNHLNCQGCPKCGIKKRGRKKLTKKEFIKRAKEAHKDKYNYSQVEYKKSNVKVCIICPVHGEFWQTPYGHLSGRGCKKCANEANGERCRSSKEEFIKKARKVHGDKYDYSKVEYVNARAKVCIICPEHGEFWQIPCSHLSGSGCPTCGFEKNIEIYGYPKENFITKSRKVHGDKYDYSKVDYVNKRTKVCIICPEHGEFWQSPHNHKRGDSCPKCNLSHLERSVMNYLDEHEIAYDYQKRFNWLGMQSLDFYLPDYKVGVECQGEQHFFPVDFAGKGVELACKKFDKQIKRDKQKKTLCEEHGIKLLYFGNVPNYDTFLGEAVHDDVQYLIDYLNEHKINRN